MSSFVEYVIIKNKKQVVAMAVIFGVVTNLLSLTFLIESIQII